MSTIADLSGEVILKTENRTSDVSRSYQWLADALTELTSSAELRDEFDNLERLGPPFNLQPTVREYPFSTLLLPSDYNDGTLNIRLWNDPPFNSTSQRLDNISYQEGDNFSNNPGRPSAWYRFADMYGFDLIPDNSYTIQARYQMMHPLASPVQNTVVLLPRDWNDVLVLEASRIGFIELNQYEKSQAIWQELHGDPSDPRRRPGLIYRRKKRFEREAWRKEKGLKPVVGRYNRR
jgi:hypothetical protein